MTTLGRKRRALETGNDGDDFPTRRSKVSSTTTLLESNELQSLRAELEHERSLRQIDQRRAQQAKARLERQLEFASEEAEEAKQLVEEIRTSSEEHMDKLRDQRQETIMELRECQAQLTEFDEFEGLEREHEATQDKVVQLEAQLEARSEEVVSLRQQLEDVIADGRAKAVQQTNQNSDRNEEETVSGQSSPAPKAVLQELNRHRVALAESERKYRQLRRKTEDWQQKAQQFVHQKETATAAKLRVSKLELTVQQMRKELEYLSATNEKWVEFAKEMGEALKLSPTIGGGPPEVSTVMRFLQKQMHHTKMIESEKATLERELTNAVERVQVLEKQARDAATATARAKRDQEIAEKELGDAKHQVQTLRAQEKIWRREADSLRSLAKTYDTLVPGQQSPAGGAAIKSMELALTTARDEIQLVKQERDKLVKQVETTATGKQTLEKEHDRVIDKFTKLRDALMVERTKAEKAEDRAIQAETLAGKGQFNPERTRVLHLEKNPLSDAIKERHQSELTALRKQLEKAGGDASTTGLPSHTYTLPEVDPEKLHKRLKDTFKEQIGVFREGVYLITGYKIDMLLDKSTPYFKVRSVYGEREEDVLIFNWPKGVKQPKSLDLRATEFASVLSKTDAYQYLTKFDSMPGFMASTQLSLLEKCTFVAASDA